uniref:EF-hand domain-containing protein n=1 Tax=Chromera velia CCMP2878 TaxID=1169474 RepID=A0A0G4IBR2_9ALVE|eukprot:Cvel_12863.t1-p1 / transcript=Cvel_12863.t1 / gene=Cvel_12863 / organism=Chromera_velia_CCMP2878 / gene_product=Calcyphosin-2, putative / transcript_product=Calcyphosin-2, putative / location=Cvel_scaffold858:40060-48200(+) / protein_length=624 / sequence_SO=supercontig / SO=protein_coding / is_pseudo=false
MWNILSHTQYPHTFTKQKDWTQPNRYSPFVSEEDRGKEKSRLPPAGKATAYQPAGQLPPDFPTGTLRPSFDNYAPKGALAGGTVATSLRHSQKQREIQEEADRMAELQRRKAAGSPLQRPRNSRGDIIGVHDSLDFTRLYRNRMEGGAGADAGSLTSRPAGLPQHNPSVYPRPEFDTLPPTATMVGYGYGMDFKRAKEREGRRQSEVYREDMRKPPAGVTFKDKKNYDIVTNNKLWTTPATSMQGSDGPHTPPNRDADNYGGYSEGPSPSFATGRPEPPVSHPHHQTVEAAGHALYGGQEMSIEETLQQAQTGRGGGGQEFTNFATFAPTEGTSRGGQTTYGNFCLGQMPQTSYAEEGGEPVDLLVEGLRQRMAKERMGATGVWEGMQELLALFRQKDPNSEGLIDRRGFAEAMSEMGLMRNQGEADALFSLLDTSGGGFVQYLDFLQRLQSNLSPQRRQLVRMVFERLDVGRTGVVRMSALVSAFAPERHPAVICHLKSADEIYKEVTSIFGAAASSRVGGGDALSPQDMEALFEGLSLQIQSDEYFELILRNCWRIGGNGAPLRTTRISGAEEPVRILVTHPNGEQTVETLTNPSGMVLEDSAAVMRRLRHQGLDPISIKVL